MSCKTLHSDSPEHVRVLVQVYTRQPFINCIRYFGRRRRRRRRRLTVRFPRPRGGVRIAISSRLLTVVVLVVLLHGKCERPWQLRDGRHHGVRIGDGHVQGEQISAFQEAVLVEICINDAYFLTTNQQLTK